MTSFYGHQDNLFPPPDSAPAAECPVCGQPLYPGDVVFKVGKEVVGCERCVTESEVAV